MIVGNGVDIVEISRIESILSKQPRFLERNFTQNEIQLFQTKQMRAETIAANFAAKEAISKAMGTGIRGFELKEMEILRNSLGKPVVMLYGAAEATATKLGIARFEISLSHHSKDAIAFVIALSE